MAEATEYPLVSGLLLQALGASAAPPMPPELKGAFSDEMWQSLDDNQRQDLLRRVAAQRMRQMKDSGQIGTMAAKKVGGATNAAAEAGMRKQLADQLKQRVLQQHGQVSAQLGSMGIDPQTAAQLSQRLLAPNTSMFDNVMTGIDQVGADVGQGLGDVKSGLSALVAPVRTGR